jgi:PKD domain
MIAPRRAFASALAISVIGAAGSMLAAAPASAESTWLAPAPLSAPGGDAETPQVSVNAQGDAVAVWQRSGVIEASGRPAGSSAWQAPVTLSQTGHASVPQVGLDAQGDAVAVWLSFDGAKYSVQAATRQGLSGAWQPPTQLESLGISEPPGPKLAMDPGGDAVVAWAREEKVIETASRPAGGSFHSETPLSITAAAQHPAVVAIDAAGDATAVWEDGKTGESLITAASKPAGGSWQTPQALSAAGQNANEPRVAMNAPGDAVAVWERPESQELIEAAGKPASGVWGKSVALTKPEGGKGEPANQEVGIDAQGDAVATWSREDAAHHDLVEATEGRVSTSVWRSPVSVSGPGAKGVEEKPGIAVNGQGNAAIVWERSNGSNEIIEAASGPAAGGSWQAPVALSATGQDASEAEVGLDERGDAIGTWQRFDGAHLIAEAAINDVGPQLNSLSVPTSGVAGQPLAFSVSPLFAVWPAAGTTWRFGDGATATGSAVTHAFAAAGAYQVNVTSTDTIGGSASATATVAIAAAAVPPRKVSAARVAPAPRITGARLTRSRFRVSKRATALSARLRAPQGTSFHFTLSEAAKVRIAFKRSLAGLRSGRRCVAPSKKLSRRHAKRCTRTLVAGTLLRGHERKGANNVAFSGRLGTKALAPGAYTATLMAGAGGASSTPVTLSLTIVR